MWRDGKWEKILEAHSSGSNEREMRFEAKIERLHNRVWVVLVYFFL